MVRRAVWRAGLSALVQSGERFQRGHLKGASALTVSRE